MKPLRDVLWIIDYIDPEGNRAQALFTQEAADLARDLAINPKLVDRLDTETMTLKEEVKHGSSRKRKAHA